MGTGAWNYVLLVFSMLACGNTKSSPLTAASVLPLASIPSEVTCLLGAGRWYKGPVPVSAGQWEHAHWQEYQGEAS